MSIDIEAKEYSGNHSLKVDESLVLIFFHISLFQHKEEATGKGCKQV
jgi:hypothetical protein